MPKVFFLVKKNEVIHKVEQVEYEVEIEIPDNITNKEKYLIDLINDEEMELDLNKIISIETINGQIVDEEIISVEELF